MEPSKPANSVAKALRVLHAVARADGPHRLGDIAERSGVPKATAHRVLATLVEEGYAAPDGEGRYGCGVQLHALAAQVLADDAVGIDAVLRALQQRLGQAVHLAVLSGDHATYTHKVDPGHAYRIATDVGTPLPLHATAAGKALLAHLPPAEVADILSRTGLPARTARTHTDRAALLDELAAIREAGYATDYEEADEAICSLAAPVRDADGTAVGAVSVSSLAFLVTESQLGEFAPAVKQAAQDVSRRL
ncbi:IclR family transcriptional regulator [Streptomyces sp. SID14478]|uniref:IclR family transcriptional regulator n=1 Tax=Streptomyces sp. SID14478 TaxID=2706073 RepID=UPI0013D98A82|nr:IclR family transcriptional regulator [Streptomyces sp. SID14478]NEB79787.1 IclR family transcriptional regulator [Streptomyces sp. SID14478]